MSEFLHTAVLEELTKLVETRQQEHRARMAKGLPVEEYREFVGRDKECRELIGAIKEIAEKNEVTLNDERS